MGKVLMREMILVMATGLFGWLAVPALLGQPPAWPLLAVGLFLGLTFTPLHALALAVGQRLKNWLRLWLGVFAWLFAFQSSITAVLLVNIQGARLTPQAVITELAPPALGLLLTLLAALRAPAGQRFRSATLALFLYSLPMWVVRDGIVRLVGPGLVPTLMTMLGGTFYMSAHGLLRILRPTPAEDEERTAPLLVRRPVPDAVVGLVEGTLRRPARPWATTEAGVDEQAISVLCRPDEADDAVRRLTAVLAQRPFAVTRGLPEKDKVEVVIRPRD
ncbi:MAG TPA: hypothetical protein VD969_11335 [Symbiobacteriaceae bacterium]|nr:hypothetical protein [Symbiobacteriaceae bacterium]